MKMCWNDQLTDKEVYYLGKIVAHWGAIEYEVFMQTLQTYEDSVSDPKHLPKEMKNMSFASVLELWENRVINNMPSQNGKFLRAQLQEIKDAKEFRNTLVHSMLHWSPSDIGRIIASRVKKTNYIQVDITGDDLFAFYLRLAEINFNLRSPSGLEQVGKRRMEAGDSFNRRGLAMLSGHDILADWLPSSKPDSGGK